jgi:tRNA (adenine-N(1)-)-methyltransferase non-catalytic subunit
LGKFGSFNANDILNKPFGLTFEILQDKTLRVLPPDDVTQLFTAQEDLTSNQYHLDGGLDNQLYTQEDIEAMKLDEDQSSRDIAAAVVRGNKTYEEKSEFAKEKYRSRTNQKFLKAFTPLRASMKTIYEHFFQKDPSKIMYLRTDTLALLLSTGVVREGGQYLVIDDIGGMLVGAILERMGDEGKVLVLHENQMPTLETLKYCSTIPPVSQLQSSEQLLNLDFIQAFCPGEDEEEKELASLSDDKYQARLERRAWRDHIKTVSRNLFYERNFDSYIAILKNANCSLMMTTNFSPKQLLCLLLPHVKPGSPFVLYCPFREVLVETGRWIQSNSFRDDIANIYDNIGDVHDTPMIQIHKSIAQKLRIISLNIMEVQSRKWVTGHLRTRPVMSDSNGIGGIMYGYVVHCSTNEVFNNAASNKKRFRKRR